MKSICEIDREKDSLIFRRWSGKGFAVFASLGREVSIAALNIAVVAMLSSKLVSVFSVDSQTGEAEFVGPSAEETEEESYVGIVALLFLMALVASMLQDDIYLGWSCIGFSSFFSSFSSFLFGVFLPFINLFFIVGSLLNFLPRQPKAALYGIGTLGLLSFVGERGCLLFTGEFFCKTKSKFLNNG